MSNELAMSSGDMAVTQFGGFTPQNLQQAMDLARLIADSDLAPKEMRGKPGNVLIAVQMGQELGLKPMQSIQNIAIINGKPTVYGDALMGIVRQDPRCEEIVEDVAGQGDAAVATCTVRRRDNPTPITRTFSVADAKKAGLWGKQGPWSQYPARMLQMRARGFALRDAFADVLKGLITREEAEDYPQEPKPAPLSAGRHTTRQPAPPQKVAVTVADVPPAAPVQEAAADTGAVTDPPKPDAAPAQAPAASGGRKISDKQRARMYAIGKGSKWTDDQMKELIGVYGYEHSADVLMGQDYDAIVDHLSRPYEKI